VQSATDHNLLLPKTGSRCRILVFIMAAIHAGRKKTKVALKQLLKACCHDQAVVGLEVKNTGTDLFNVSRQWINP
jgi:hypothetical protein